MDKIVETKTCRQCNTSFDITQKDIDFYNKVSPVFGGEKILIPTPTLCPKCRQQRRLSFRNERNLYKRKCDATGKDIVSMYSPDKKTKVYIEEFWWSDKWDGLDYGIDFDENKGVFDQLQILFDTVPQPALINNYLTHDNSNYANYSGYLKNCYLVFECGSGENLFYSESSRHMNDSLDISMGTRCQESYFCFNIFDCHKLYYSSHCEKCSDSYYLRDCKDCKFCYHCQGLSHASYCIENIQYSEQEYFEKIKDLPRHYDSGLFHYISEGKKVPHIQSIGSENVTGDYIVNSKDVKESYHVKNLENGKYCSYLSSSSKKSQDCYDYDYFGGVRRVYESTTIGGESDSILFCLNTWEVSSRNILCNMCHMSTDMFACVGLRNKKYCIFNKQYTKQEYEELVPKIIHHMKQTGEWREFFPTSMSPFGYNETVAYQHYPLMKNDAIKQGYSWSDYEAPFSKVDKIVPADKLPLSIDDVPDDILNWAIECRISKRPFRIIEKELDFYRKHGLPIPKLHPEERHKERMKLRNPRKLYERNCDTCKKEIQTTYSGDREERIYCDDCYNKETYG